MVVGVAQVFPGNCQVLSHPQEVPIAPHTSPAWLFYDALASTPQERPAGTSTEPPTWGGAPSAVGGRAPGSWRGLDPSPQDNPLLLGHLLAGQALSFPRLDSSIRGVERCLPNSRAGARELAQGLG